MILRDSHFGAADKDVRDDTDVSEFCDRMLRRFGLELSRRFQIRNKREVDEAAVFRAYFKTELTRSFEERKRFDVACDSADLAENDVGAAFSRTAEGVFDLVRDVRNHLDCAAEIRSGALFCDDR